MDSKTYTMLQIMLILFHSDKHGYGIMKESGMNITTIYRVLAHMIGIGFIAESKHEERKIYYHLTELGKSFLIEEIEKMEAFIQLAHERMNLK